MAKKVKTGRTPLTAPIAADAPPVPKGCCTISAPGVADRQIANVTDQECNAIANAHPGQVAHWVQGDCA